MDSLNKVNLNLLYGKIKREIFNLFSNINRKILKAYNRIVEYGRRSIIPWKNKNNRNPDRIIDDANNDFPFCNKRAE